MKPHHSLTVAVLVTLGATHAACTFPSDYPTDAWNDQATGARWDAIDIAEVRVAVSLDEELAIGELEVDFVTEREMRSEGEWTLRLPAGAVVTGAETYLPQAERWERAETLGRREGELAYEAIVEPRPSQDPLLLQRIGPDLYRARLFPVSRELPGRIRISYRHLLAPVASGRFLALPHAASLPDEVSAPSVHELAVTLLAPAAAWQGARWVNVGETVIIDEQPLSDGRLTARLRGEALNAELGIALESSVPRASVSAIGYQPSASDLPSHLHVGWHPDFSAYPSVTPGPRNVVFVLDTSGSMQGAKIIALKAAVDAALSTLTAADYFDVVRFSATASAFRSQMESGAARGEAARWVSSLWPDGQTDLAAGLTLAAQVGATSPVSDAAVDLLLVTDGRPTFGPATLEGLLAELDTAVVEHGRPLRVFTCGIGYDVDPALLTGLAAATGGESMFALADEAIGAQIAVLFDRVRGGGASGVEVELAAAGLGEPILFTWSRVFPGMPLHLAATGVMSGEVSITLTATTPAGEPITLRESRVVALGDTGAALQAPALAAKAWADALERAIDQTLESPARVTEAVLLAKTYGIVSRYSSLLALETPEMYEAAGIDRVERDPAGIALSEVTASVVDESRVGGEPLTDAVRAQAPRSSYGDGCTCRSGAAPVGAGLVAALWLAVGRRRSRR